METGNDILTPWYAPGKKYDDGGKTNSRDFKDFLRAKEESKKPAKPKPAPEPQIEKKLEIPHRTIVDKHTPDTRFLANDNRTRTMAEFTACMLRTLHGKAGFPMRRQDVNSVCEAWFKERLQEGLYDVAFVADHLFDNKETMIGKESAAIICWYKDGKMSRVTLDNRYGEPHVDVKDLPANCWRKPLFPDPYHELHEALLDMASVAPMEYWAELFLNAAHTLESDDSEYDKQPGLFYLPQPYFKYLRVIDMTYLGGGMGSWNDLGIRLDKSTRLAQDELYYQKSRAMLYAVNNL